MFAVGKDQWKLIEQLDSYTLQKQFGLIILFISYLRFMYFKSPACASFNHFIIVK